MTGLPENLQEAPETESTQHGDRDVVVPAEDIHEFATGSYNTGNKAHNSECQGTGDDSLRRLGSPAKEVPNTIRDKVQTASEHGGAFGVIGESSDIRDKPAPEGGGSGNTHEPGGQASGEALSLTELEGIPAVQAAKGGGGGVAPAEKEDAHDTNVLGKEAQDCVCAQQIPNHTVIARHLCLAH